MKVGVVVVAAGAGAGGEGEMGFLEGLGHQSRWKCNRVNGFLVGSHLG